MLMMLKRGPADAVDARPDNRLMLMMLKRGPADATDVRAG